MPYIVSVDTFKKYTMNTSNLKLGKLAPKPVKLMLKSFINSNKLPKPPKHFGHEDLMNQRDWGMLGNDKVGDCAIAAKMHIQMLMSATANTNVNFSEDNAIKAYSAITGYNPNDPDSDQGANMRDVAGYWRNTGLYDDKLVNHKIKAYVGFDPQNITELYQALYLFTSVDIGIQFPESAMTQFGQGKPWKVVKGAKVVGGHDVCIVAKRTSIECVTWGKIQPITLPFFHKYNDESFAYVSEEALVNNKSPEGFDAQGLLDALHSLV